MKLVHHGPLVHQGDFLFSFSHPYIDWFCCSKYIIQYHTDEEIGELLIQKMFDGRWRGVVKMTLNLLFDEWETVRFEKLLTYLFDSDAILNVLILYLIY